MDIVPYPGVGAAYWQGSTRATTGHLGGSQGSRAGLSTTPHSNLHLPLAPQDPLLRTTARFSVFDKVLRKQLPVPFSHQIHTHRTDMAIL